MLPWLPMRCRYAGRASAMRSRTARQCRAASSAGHLLSCPADSVEQIVEIGFALDGCDGVRKCGHRRNGSRVEVLRRAHRDDAQRYDIVFCDIEIDGHTVADRYGHAMAPHLGAVLEFLIVPAVRLSLLSRG